MILRTRDWLLGHFMPGSDNPLRSPGVPHSFRSLEESLILTVRWPSIRVA